jgi:serine/threonine protein kinase
MPRGRTTPDAIYEIIKAKFGDYEIIGHNNSPNGRHFILKNNTATKHVKVVKKSYLNSNEASEIDLLNSISSNHIIRLEAHGELDNKNDYLLFPHINGKTLDKLKDEVTWDDVAIKKLAIDVVKGIKDLNRAGITHRDIKPKNIIRDETTGNYVILDLGVGYFMEGPNRDNAKIPRGSGSRFYSAPEQFKITLNEPYCLTSATDQFSLAVVIYELATKNHPFISSDTSEPQNYANAVTGGVDAQGLDVFSLPISAEVISTISKMMSIEPSQRFIKLDELEAGFGTAVMREVRKVPKLYIQLPNEDKEEFIEFLGANPNTVDGVVVGCSDKLEWSEKVEELGLEVVLDPKTYQLPLNKSTSDIVKSLKLTEYSQYGIYEIMEMKEELLLGAHKYSKTMLSRKTILPYFNVERANGPYLKFTKKLWDEARAYYTDKGLDATSLYGGLVIPYSVIIDDTARAAVLSQLMTKHPIDGVFVILESAAPRIATTTDKAYLEGIKHISEFLEAVFDDVIFYRVDISLLPFINNASFATGWAKAARHFKLSGSGRNIGYKMKYYAPKLFTFIEEKSSIRTIIDSGNGYNSLHCECTYCSAANPLERAYTPHPVNEKGHFFGSITELHTQTASLSVEDKNEHFRQYLQDAQQRGSEIKQESGGVISSETIPSYEALIALIDS